MTTEVMIASNSARKAAETIVGYFYVLDSVHWIIFIKSLSFHR